MPHATKGERLKTILIGAASQPGRSVHWQLPLFTLWDSNRTGQDEEDEGMNEEDDEGPPAFHTQTCMLRLAAVFALCASALACDSALSLIEEAEGYR